MGSAAPHIRLVCYLYKELSYHPNVTNFIAGFVGTLLSRTELVARSENECPSFGHLGRTLTSILVILNAEET